MGTRRESDGSRVARLLLNFNGSLTYKTLFAQVYLQVRSLCGSNCGRDLLSGEVCGEEEN